MAVNSCMYISFKCSLIVCSHMSSRLNTPSSYRGRAGSLAKATGGKILMVKLRLAPQSPFPTAFLDVFQTYLLRLASPPNSPHEAIPAKNIVLAGDSSRSVLALSLLQVLLQLKRKNIPMKFHENTLQPAGLTLLSVTTDLVNALLSHERNITHGIFPSPIEKLPYLEKSFPTVRYGLLSPHEQIYTARSGC